MNAQTKIAATAPAIGTACDLPGGNGLAYIVAVEAAESGLYTIGAGGLTRDQFSATLAGPGGYYSEGLSEGALRPMIERARHVAPISESDAAALAIEAKAARDASRAKLREDEAHRLERERENRTLYDSLRPAWAVGALVAELVEDCSDLMSDYHGSRTVRRVILCWARHERDLFPEMRKAASLFPETAELEHAPDNAEHREKYSMGGGFYLKNGWRDSDGWKVSKDCYSGGGYGGLEFTDAARAGLDVKQAASGKASAPAATGGGASVAGGFTITEHTHTKKGFQMWIAQLADRVDRDTFDALRDAAKGLGGWYSRPWGKTPGGFAFKVESDARQFAVENGSEASGKQVPGTRAPAPRPAVNPAEKLRTLADGMAPAITACFADRLSNTPKRARQAAEKRNEGLELERAQSILRALADAHDAGKVPGELVDVTTKAAALELAKEACDRGGGYYDAGTPLGRPYDWAAIGKPEKAARAAAAWAMLGNKEGERAKALELAAKVEALQFASIPGYFPTPGELVARMIEAAGLEAGQRVLEPSAGSGAIADAVRDAGAAVECVEKWSSLADILEAKGHNVTRADFLDLAPMKGEAFGPVEGEAFDVVLMNPPFEKAQDVAHVRHALQFVKPGGALVAIMGAGVTFRKDSAYADFRAWLDDLGGELVELPAGAFKASGTGVASVMVTVHRD